MSSELKLESNGSSRTSKLLLLFDKDFWRSCVTSRDFWSIFLSGFGYGAVSILYWVRGPSGWYNIFLAFPLTTAVGIMISLRKITFTLLIKTILAALFGSIIVLPIVLIFMFNPAFILIAPGIIGFSISAGVFLSIFKRWSILSPVIWIIGGLGLVGLTIAVMVFNLVAGEMQGYFFLGSTGSEFGASFFGALIAFTHLFVRKDKV